MSSGKRILLGQLASNGDCVYATTVARQIKHDYPDCALTWAIGAPWRQVIENNPHVDEVWEVPISDRSQLSSVWRSFVRDARGAQRAGRYDEVFLTQIFPDNFANYDGTVRASIFRGYPHPITVPITPVIRLTEAELEAAEAFIAEKRLRERGPVVLFEVGPRSGQSFVTAEWAVEVARRVRRTLPEAVFVISSSDRVQEEDGIVDGSQLRFRENVVLTSVCSLVIGCSSGITWLCTSDAALPLPMVQFLKRTAGPYGAVALDLDYWGLPSSQVVEMDECSPSRAADCVTEVLTAGTETARSAYGRDFRLELAPYFEGFWGQMAKGHPRAATRSLGHTVRRFGFRREIPRGAIRGAWNILNRRLSRD